MEISVNPTLLVSIIEQLYIFIDLKKSLYELLVPPIDWWTTMYLKNYLFDNNWFDFNFQFIIGLVSCLIFKGLSVDFTITDLNSCPEKG